MTQSHGGAHHLQLVFRLGQGDTWNGLLMQSLVQCIVLLVLPLLRAMLAAELFPNNQRSVPKVLVDQRYDLNSLFDAHSTTRCDMEADDMP